MKPKHNPKRRAVVYLVVSLALVAIGLLLWKSTRRESLQEAAINFSQAFDKRDFKTVARYISDEELHALKINRDQAMQIISDFSKLSGQKVQKTGALSLEPYPDRGALRFHQSYTSSDGQLTTGIGCTMYETEDGPRVVPAIDCILGYDMALSTPPRGTINKIEMLGYWIAWVTRNRNKLESAGLMGAFRLPGSLMNPNGKGFVETWDMRIARFEKGIAMLQETK